MRTSDRLVGSRLRQCIEQFDETRLVRVTSGGFAIWLDPFGMLDPQIVVNLSPELAVSMDLVRHGNLLGEGSSVARNRSYRGLGGIVDERSSRECAPPSSEATPKGSSYLPLLCATLGQLDHFVPLALQQNCQQSALRKG